MKKYSVYVILINGSVCFWRLCQSETEAEFEVNTLLSNLLVVNAWYEKCE